MAVQLTVPFSRSDLVDRFHRTGRVDETRFDEAGTTILGHLPAAALGRFAPYVAVRTGGSAAPAARHPDPAASAPPDAALPEPAA